MRRPLTRFVRAGYVLVPAILASALIASVAGAEVTSQSQALQRLVPAVNGSVTTDVITVDNEAEGLHETFSHTVQPGSKQLLIVTTDAYRDCNAEVSATYNGIPMTLGARGTFFPDGTTGWCHAYFYLVSPPIGTHDVVVTLPLGGLAGSAAVTIKNVDQTTPVDTDARSYGTSASPTVELTTTVPNELIFYYFVANTNPPVDYVPVDGVLYSIDGIGGDNSENVGAVHLQESADTVTIGTTGSANNAWELTAIPIRPAH